MRLLAALLLVCACAPRWMAEGYRGEARSEAALTASREHTCPIDRVVMRCDASTRMSISDGQFVVGDSAVQTLTESVPVWEVELDVCGQIRRYRHIDDRFVEQVPRCDDGVCVSAEPACRSVARRPAWWAVEAAAPKLCHGAVMDDGLDVGIDRGYLTINLHVDGVNRGSFWLAGDCKQPSLMAVIDDRWFALCGPLLARHIAVDPAGSLLIEPGIVLAGRHKGAVVYVAPTDHCIRSPERELAVRPLPLSWLDL